MAASARFAGGGLGHGAKPFYGGQARKHRANGTTATIIPDFTDVCKLPLESQRFCAQRCKLESFPSADCAFAD